DERHGVVRAAHAALVLDHAGRKDRDDVGMLQPGRVVDFRLEPLHAEPGHEIRRKQLHHDLALEELFLGDEDPGHAAARQLAGDAEAGSEGGLKIRQEIGRHEWPGGLGGWAGEMYGGKAERRKDGEAEGRKDGRTERRKDGKTESWGQDTVTRKAAVSTTPLLRTCTQIR